LALSFGRTRSRHRASIQPGDLDQLIDIRRVHPGEEQSDAGDPEDKRRYIARGVWAKTVPTGGTLRDAADRTVSDVSRDFIIHHRDDVTVMTEIVWNGSTWKSHDVREDDGDGRTWLIISTSQVQ
jgi:hypothetical protein